MVFAVVFEAGILPIEGLVTAEDATRVLRLSMNQPYMSTKVSSSVHAGESNLAVLDVTSKLISHAARCHTDV